MSGVASGISNVAQAIVKPVIDTPMSIYRAGKSLAQGGDLVDAAKAGFAPLARDILKPGQDKLYGSNSNIGTGINNDSTGILGVNTPPPGQAAIDPALEAKKSAEEKARLKRQEQVNILTDRPGRGGTILTDNYSYKV